MTIGLAHASILLARTHLRQVTLQEIEQGLQQITLQESEQGSQQPIRVAAIPRGRGLSGRLLLIAAFAAMSIGKKSSVCGNEALPLSFVECAHKRLSMLDSVST